MWLLINNWIYIKNFEMVKQKKRTCITQSGKNYAIQGVRLIWKQKIWLAICKFLWSLTNQNAWFVSSFCTELTLFCTVFEKNCTALNQSNRRNFFMYIIREINKKQWFQCWILGGVWRTSSKNSQLLVFDELSSISRWQPWKRSNSWRV